MKIDDLADFPALRQVERALWKQGKTRGAAVFVGAGFSRNAELSNEGAAAPPLWNDLARAMEARLDNTTGRTRDPLRTAEEYRAVLGQPALEGLIRELIPDDQWLPGVLHKKLVALPWVDILTTNWDTLLERAAEETLGQTYETVRCIEDIATTRQPRIVKLHGSLPSNRPFVLTEEDYRTYPQIFAPFVNLVQQSLLENELCLLGFSGDDPNFLKWSGWVRDQLGASARRIYLVGALKLDTAQRRLLEQRNVSPIDLSPLVNHLERTDQQRAAAEIFLERLRTSRPKAEWEWNCHHLHPSSDLNYQVDTAQQAAALTNLASEWAIARSSYPGWAICPPALRHEIKRDTVHALQNQSALALMAARDRAKLCYETAWRFDIALLPIGQWEETFSAAVDDSAAWEEAKQRDFVIGLLLRNAREDRNLISFNRWEIELEQRTAFNPEALSWIIYERCLWARDGLDFNELAKLVPSLNGADPLWGLRRAALHSYLGDFRSARGDVDQVIAQARNAFSRNRNSMWALSRLAWAHFCAGPLRSWGETLSRDEELTSLKLRIHETQCEPWDTISDFDHEIEESLRRHQEISRKIELHFEPGTYHDASKTIRFGNSPGIVNYEMDRLADSIGVPLRTQDSVVLSQRMERTELLAPHESDVDYLRSLRIVQADQPSALNRLFGRIEVAKLPSDLLNSLKNTIKQASDYALGQLNKRQGWTDQFWSTRAAIYTEILSRLLVRADPVEALEWFRKGLTFSRDQRWHHHKLFEPLEHLLKWTLSAVPPADRGALLTEVIDFPLPGEILLPHLHAQRDWPNPSEWIAPHLMKRPDPDARIKNRVTALIEMARNGESEARKRAVFWLMQLHITGVLTLDESKSFGEALWSKRTSDLGFPSDTTLRAHMFLLLPSPDDINPRYLFKQRNHCGSAESYIISVAGATHTRPDGSRYVLFDHNEALDWFNKFAYWQPIPAPTIDLEQIGAENERATQSLGAAIADAVLPLLQAADLSSESVERIFERENDSLSIVQAYPELVRLLPVEEDRATRGIIRAVVSRDVGAAWAGFNALFRWLQSSKVGAIPKVSRKLIEATISVVETRREPGLVHALNMAGHLLQAGLLTADDMSRLAGALEMIRIEMNYDTFDTDKDGENTMWTLTRANAVRLAGALTGIGVVSADLMIWVQSAHSDPMPEVRFALGTAFE